MAVIWNTRTKRRFEIRDESGKVVSVAFASGTKSDPCKKIVFVRVSELKRKSRK